MTNRQIHLVQQSWDLIVPIADQAGMLFYQHLFTEAPQVRSLFKEDITEQSTKLVRMLTYIVSRLERLDDIIVDINRLAVSHNAYGARPEHYDVVGKCLIQTLREGLGAAWHAELEEAWSTVFHLLKEAMISAQLHHQKNASTDPVQRVDPIAM